MTTVSDRPAARQNGNRKYTQDIIKQIKEMTNAADEDIQMALQECNGDVNRAAMSILDNPFQEVKTKKVKPKPSEKTSSKPPPRDFPQREKRDYGDRSERTDRGDRGERGRGREERGGRGGGRGGRGRGFRDADASQPLAPGSRPITTSSAPAYSETLGTVPAPTTEFYEPPAAPAVPVAAPTSPPRLPASAPVGSSWASKLKPAPAPVSQPPPEPEPVETEVVAEADPNAAWGMAPQQEAIEPAQHDTSADDAFGNGFSHRGETDNAAASWGPPAPGDAAAQWGSPQELSNATLDEAVAKSFETTPAAIPTSVPATSSPTYNQHQNQQGNFDFSSMASSLGQAGYSTDTKYGNFNIRKDPAQPATSMPFQPGAMPQQTDYSAAFSNVFQPQPADSAGQADDSKAASHGYTMPPGVPNFAQFTQPPAYQTPYAGLADPSRERKQGMAEYAVHDKKDAGYGMPGPESGAEKPAASLDQRSDDQQRAAMPQPPHQQVPHDMQYSMHMPSPDMQMYSGQQPRAGSQQPAPGQQVMPGQPSVGMQQPQSQGQMGTYMPQQAGMPGYGSYGNPNMPYSAMPGFPASAPYGTMNYGMGYPPGAYPQYGYPQGQNFPAQQPPAPYGAAPAAYGGKPGYDNSYGLPQGNGGGRGGGGNAKRNKNRGFGRGAGAAHNQGMALPNEPFNPAAAPSGNYNYMDPAWNARSFDTYKQDKSMPAQQPQYENYGMQQGFQPVGYGGTYNGQQYANQPQYSNQWGGTQDSKYQ